MVEVLLWTALVAFWFGPAMLILCVNSPRLALLIGTLWMAVVVVAWCWLYLFELPAQQAAGLDAGPTLFAAMAVYTVPAIVALLIVVIVRVVSAIVREIRPPSPSA